MTTFAKGMFSLGCLVALAGLIGCEKKVERPTGRGATTTTGAEGTTTAPAVGGKTTFRIGLIAKSTNNPVFLAAQKGAEAKAAELSRQYQGKVTVEIDWQTPSTENAEEQANRINQLVGKGVDAIIVSCSDANAVTDAINGAVDKGVPVMCFDSDAPKSKRFAFYGVDDPNTGKEVMVRLAKVMGEKGVVAVLAGNQNAPNLQKRVQGIRDAIKAYPNMSIIQVYYHEETPEDAAAKVQQVMKANPNINGWAMVGGWPLFTDALMQGWNPDVKMVAVDALPQQLPYVEKGIAQVLLAQMVYDWGYISTDLTFKKVYLKEQVQEMNIMQLYPVTKDNLGEWARKLKGWGFDVQEKYLTMGAAPAAAPTTPAAAPAAEMVTPVVPDATVPAPVPATVPTTAPAK